MNETRSGENFADAVYNRIVGDILNNVLNEGDKLNEKELISKFGFSRTPIREALIMLERDGFVKTIGREGTYVRKLTQKDIRDIYIVRESLESMATILGAKTISDDDLVLLLDVVNQMDQAICNKSYDNFVKLDMEFHKLIVDACNVKLLSSICHNVGLLSASIKSRGTHYEENIKDYNSQHREIYNAFRGRDGVLAEELIRTHIQKGKMDLLLDNNQFIKD